MTTTQSKVAQMRSMEAELVSMQAKIQQMGAEIAPTLELIEKVGQAADAKQISRRELALGLCPELAQYIPSTSAAANAGVKKRRARSVKTYINPHDNSRVETKGGNNKTLKSWKRQYGAETVESWLKVDSAAA